MSELPFASIIIPARNESAYIEETLRAAVQQTYPKDLYEIIIADGNSTDTTREKITLFTAQNKMPRIQVLNNPRQTMPCGFNLALGAAKGEIIVMMSAHAKMADDYLQQCADFLTEHPEASCVGGVIATIAQDRKSEAIALAMRSPFGVGNATFRTGLKMENKTDSAVFAAYRRSVFKQIGGLDEEMTRNQDDEFNYRLRESGGVIYSTPKIRSTYFSRASLKGLWKQYFQYGLYKVRVLQKHPRQMSLRQFVPPAFVLGLLLSMLIAQFPFSFFIPTLYLSANFIASIYTANKNGWKYLPVLPIVFSILHISYGLGFLAGLFKFWNRWGDKTGKTPSL
jgi:cellulose synthase/poly-beta-1,6-N-acetylglucosamine synthase-like glycosyltransferase